MNPIIPDPDLAREIGVVSWALMVVILFGVASMAFFLRRITQAMDRMADAQEATPGIVAELKTTVVERMDRMEQKLDQAVTLAGEHVRIARMWERTEAPGRRVREDGERPH